MLFAAVALIAAGVSARPHLATRQAAAQSFSTTSDSSQLLAPQDAPVSGAGNANGASTWSLSLDDSNAGAQQTILGFGAAITDSSVSNYDALSSDQQKQLISDMVTPAGANFQLLRHTIASSDMSPNQYSYDDNNGAVDTSLSAFNLGDSGNAMAAMIKDLRAAQANLTVFGASWSPPAWMKAGDNTLNTDYADAFAQYFVKYLQAYQSAGAPIDAFTIQNEPMHNGQTDFTMGIDATTEGNLIQNNVGPALASAGLNTAIWGFDHNPEYAPDYPQTVVSTAGQYVNTIAWHCYDSPDWSQLTDFHNNNPSTTQVMTECYDGFDSSDNWSSLVDYTMGPLQNWAVGVVAWPMGTDTNSGPHLGDGCGNCDGMFQTSGSTYSLDLDYHLLAQFSKWMTKGSVVHSSTGSYKYDDGTGVNAVGSVNADGTKTMVMQNAFSNDIYLTLNTTNSGQWSGTLPANSLTTWILPA